MIEHNKSSFEKTLYIYDTLTNIERFLKCKDGCLVLPGSVYAMFNENRYEHLCSAIPMKVNIYTLGYINIDNTTNNSEPKYAISCKVIIVKKTNMGKTAISEMLNLSNGFSEPYRSVSNICNIYDISLPD